MTAKTVPQALSDLAKGYSDQGRAGEEEHLLHLGKTLLGMFPLGLQLRSAVDFNRFALLIHMQGNITQYAQALARGLNAPAALDQLSVNAQMLQRFDALIADAAAAMRAEAPAHHAPETPRPAAFPAGAGHSQPYTVVPTARFNQAPRDPAGDEVHAERREA